MSLAELPARPGAVFFDLDGVLVDFHRSVARLWGLDPEGLGDAEWAELGEWGLGVHQPGLWDRIEAEGERWWRRVRP